MLSIGIVGAGDIVRKMHLPVLQALGEVRIAWLFDAAEQRARAVGDAYQVPVVRASSPEQLPDCDVALLAVPAPVRAAYLQNFARRGIAVFCEKPFAVSSEEHRRYLEWFEPHQLGCGYMRRFYRSSMIVEHVLQQGWLGVPHTIRVGEGGRSRGSGSGHSFLDDPRHAAVGGVLMDLGTHTLDLALRFARSREFDVEHSELTLDGEIDRHARARVRLLPNVRLEYEVSWLTQQPNRLTLEFRDASVWMSLAPDARVWLGDPARPREAVELGAPQVGETAHGATTPSQAFALEWREFLAGVERRTESPVSARAALATTALAEGIRARAMVASNRSAHAQAGT
jgi:predicted dehydrogenase